MTSITLLSSLETIPQLVEQIAQKLVREKLYMTTAESCTGGAIAYFLTNLAGSSQWFDRAYITYSNQAKQDMLSVSPATLEQFGAVSEAVALEMARAALLPTIGVSVAVSGIAGPSGGSKEKPVGTVCFAWARRHGDEVRTWTETQHFPGDRNLVRILTVQCALEGIIKAIDSQ